MRQYKIKEIDVGYIIYKVLDNEGTITVLYWNGKRRDWRKESAKVYLFEDKAISSLIVAKKKGNEPC